MNSSTIADALFARWYLVLLAALAGAAVAVLSLYSLDASGLKSKTRSAVVGSAQVLVDSEQSSLATVDSSSTASTLSARAPLYAELGSSSAVHDAIARRVGLSPNALTVASNLQQGETSPYSNEPSSLDSVSEGDSVLLSADAASPVVYITTESQSAEMASRLASAATTVLRNAVSMLASQQHIAISKRIILRPLAVASTQQISTGPKVKKAAVYGIVTFIVLVLILVTADSFVAARRQRRSRPAATDTPA